MQLAFLLVFTVSPLLPNRLHACLVCQSGHAPVPPWGLSLSFMLYEHCLHFDCSSLLICTTVTNQGVLTFPPNASILDDVMTIKMSLSDDHVIFQGLKIQVLLKV
jgi:hypothetical protein